MNAKENSKLKLLHVLHMLQEETDAEHGLTMQQIIANLAEVGIDAERKSIYSDFEAIRQFGIQIVKIGGRPVSYGLAKRAFDQAEISLLIDAVQSSRFLTERKSEQLVKSISRMATPAARRNLQKQVHVHRRPLRQDTSDFRNVDIIQRAIANGNKVQFHYFHYAEGAQKSTRNAPYVRTPVCVIYSDDNYYMVAYDDAHDGLANFRVDRMERLIELDEHAANAEIIKEFDPKEIAKTAFGMYTGNKVRATFHVKPEAMNVVIDRFGREVNYRRLEDGNTSFTVNIMESPVFFGWLCQLGSAIQIESPPELREHYKEYLQNIIENL